MSSMLLERFQIAEGVPPVLLNDADNDGDWVSLKDYDRILILFGSGLGTATQDPTIIIQQATSNAGAGVKDLDIVTVPVQIHKKQAATSLAAVGQWSSAIAGVTTNKWTDGEAAEQDVLLAIEFKADQLDVDGGFDHIRATVADPGANAQPGFLLYFMGDPSFERGPTKMLSAL